MINYCSPTQLSQQFESASPIRLVVLDNFLDQTLIQNLNQECLTIDSQYWKTFNRNGSHMKECNNIDVMPTATKFVALMHSPKTLQWLEQVTGITSLIPDPYLIGAGYSKSYTGDQLKVHTDFNWNDQLKLHRALSLIVYLTPEWNPEYNGSLDFYNSTRSEVVTSIDCLHNRCVIWEQHERGFHGYEKSIACPKNMSRNTFRLFYYTSKLEPLNPHRSLYWYNETTGEPYDIK